MSGIWAGYGRHNCLYTTFFSEGIQTPWTSPPLSVKMSKYLFQWIVLLQQKRQNLPIWTWELKTTRKIRSSKVGSETWKIRSSKFKIQSQSSKFKVQISKFKVQSSKFKVQTSKFKVQRLAARFRGGLGRSPIGVRCAIGNVYPRLICHKLVQFFKVATFPFKDGCTAAHVLRSSATHFSIVMQDYTYLKKEFYRNCRAHEGVKIIIRTDDIVAEKWN